MRALRWVAGLDRSYFLALSAFIASVVASIFLAFVPIAEQADGSAISLIEESGAVFIVLIVLPVMVMSAPLIALPQAPGPREKNDKINSVASSGVLLAYAVAFATSFGLFYMPALILTIASSVSLFFGRKQHAFRSANAHAEYPVSKVDENGVRLSRSAIKRAKQEAASTAPAVQGETPLASSRRRRGRKRRSRR